MDAEQAKSLLAQLDAELQPLKTNRDEVRLDALLRRTRVILAQLFGPQSAHIREFEAISFTPTVRYFTVNGSARNEPNPVSWETGWNQFHNLLDALALEISLAAAPGSKDPQPSGQTESVRAISNQVFVVHGHDDGMKQAVARVLEKLGLHPIILHEEANKGRTVIEKLAAHTDTVSFAVVLLSPDDMGYSKADGREAAKPRARQNVVFEFGLLTGKLGRSAIAVLHPASREFEVPTDLQGVLYIPYDEHESWKYGLVKELRGFGFDVSADRLIGGP